MVDPLQIDEYRREPGARIAAQEIEAFGFLQFTLEPLGHLLKRVIERRAGPEACTIIVLKVKAGSSLRPSRK